MLGDKLFLLIRFFNFQVQGSNFEVGPVLSSGNMWITRDRLRLVEKAVVEPKHIAVPRKSLRQKAGCVIM